MFVAWGIFVLFFPLRACLFVDLSAAQLLGASGGDSANLPLSSLQRPDSIFRAAVVRRKTRGEHHMSMSMSMSISISMITIHVEYLNRPCTMLTHVVSRRCAPDDFRAVLIMRGDLKCNSYKCCLVGALGAGIHLPRSLEDVSCLCSCAIVLRHNNAPHTSSNRGLSAFDLAECSLNAL